MVNKPAPTSVAPPANPEIIRDYHAHIYYDPASSRDRAARLRERVAAAFPEATLGRWHDELVGPHPQSMYQIAFPRGMLASFLPWLMLNRDGLTILLHPGTGNDYADHSDHAVWFGAVLPLRLEVLKGARKTSPP
jgi:aromatic ring-cleaving dioxygenase